MQQEGCLRATRARAPHLQSLRAPRKAGDIPQLQLRVQKVVAPLHHARENILNRVALQHHLPPHVIRVHAQLVVNNLQRFDVLAQHAAPRLRDGFVPRGEREKARDGGGRRWARRREHEHGARGPR